MYFINIFSSFFGMTRYKHFKKLMPISFILDRVQFHDALYEDDKGWAYRFFSCLCPFIPGVINPYAKLVQQWNKFFVISCLLSIFVDPLFSFLLSVEKENSCIVLDRPLTTTLVVFRSITDFIFLLHILLQKNESLSPSLPLSLQFRLAYVALESTVVGGVELVQHPKKIALNYLQGYFLLDFFIVLPLPQIIILNTLGLTGANHAKNLLRAAVLLQYIPRLYRFLPLLAGPPPSGFIFESAWPNFILNANFIINLLTFVLSGHLVGSCWYLFGLQRVSQCFREACHNSGIKGCMNFLDCGPGSQTEDSKADNPLRLSWRNNVNATACLTADGFDYGIYVQAVNLTTENSMVTRYVYGLFWGFQQISTLAGNQAPSYFVWEVLFTMAIAGLGLLLFALLIGNMQNFLQGLGRRRLEMSLRRRDVEQWMRHRRLPEELRGLVREVEWYNWAATRGVNDEMFLEVLPEDLQMDVRIFALMDEPIVDSICGRLRQKIYIRGSKILYRGGLIEKMVFIVRGIVESIGENGHIISLSEGDVCGEELLTWCLEHSSVNKVGKMNRIPGQRLLSNRMVRCLTNVEGFSLQAADIEEVISVFSRFLRTPRVQGAIRYESPYWRALAAIRIQVAWRYRKKRLQRARHLSISISLSTPIRSQSNDALL
ncbi:probable cyclic nucleotide-gated ion channel 20, chloroplastic isoform X2 [Malus sylvestris]|uniref:probable cyclic nucleotide-gated ion channel 20, chloroplastic isoform X2 n=1 Tax=Malus sylvestris TaxID=3752 RepID=UPI0021AD276A|nr:probable cyclic nucleotide-gated ion channel 20, chloroplastic isoform X2 [Malus sylvestris]